MQDDANWSDEPPKKPKSGLGDLVLPLLTFALGAGLTYILFLPPAEFTPAQVPTATFGAAAPAQQAQAVTAPGAQEELELMREINNGFVEQLRGYRDRLNGMADTADQEGAPNSAEAMRDFAVETGQIIDRYDMIVKATNGQ